MVARNVIPGGILPLLASYPPDPKDGVNASSAHASLENSSDADRCGFSNSAIVALAYSVINQACIFRTLYAHTAAVGTAV